MPGKPLYGSRDISALFDAETREACAEVFGHEDASISTLAKSVCAEAAAALLADPDAFPSGAAYHIAEDALRLGIGLGEYKGVADATAYNPN